MKIKILLFAGMSSAMLLLSGCTRMYNSNEVSLANTNQILTYETGTVTDIKMVIIKDDGSGTMVGAYSGAILGSLFGGGRGNILSTLIGGLTGAYAGNKLDKANAQELFIKLDNGKNIVVIAKGVKIKKGDKVRLIMNGNRVVRVEKIATH